MEHQIKRLLQTLAHSYSFTLVTVIVVTAKGINFPRTLIDSRVGNVAHRTPAPSPIQAILAGIYISFWRYLSNTHHPRSDLSRSHRMTEIERIGYFWNCDAKGDSRDNRR